MGLKRLKYTQEIARRRKRVGWVEVRGRLKKEGIIYIHTYGGFTSLYWRREWQTTLAFCLENSMNSMKRQKDMTPKDAPSRSVGVQNVTEEEREEWRNSSRRNEESDPKWRRCPFLDVSGGESKVRCYKEQYCIGTWNVRSMNQGKLEVVKQEMARVNIDILGISELKWTGMCKFNSDDHYI